jgi:dolichol-phosphate mannosyltransferase
MYKTLLREELDMVIGSRYSEGGGIGAWSQQRAMISRVAGRLSQGLVPPNLKDPMSGFFMIRRTTFMECVRHLSTLGFKILLDIFASSPRPLRFAEIPYQFRNRHAGESKLDSQVAWDFGMLLLDKSIGHLVPVRFISFAFVGGLGLLVHMGVLSLVYLSESAEFAAAQTIASIAAIAFNFTLNNRITYRDRRLHGVHWWRGLISFFAACSIGALANVGVAQYLFTQRQGWVFSALAGVAVAAVWNYAVTANYTWKTSRK